MLDQQSIPGGLTIYNYQLDVAELMNHFAQYDQMFFFCPKYTRSAVEVSVQNTLEAISNYNPLRTDRNLMTCLIEDIEVYYANNPDPSLMDSEYLNKLEVIANRIEQSVEANVRQKLPMNQQCHIFWPKWCGNTLVFALRIY